MLELIMIIIGAACVGLVFSIAFSCLVLSYVMNALDKFNREV